jgi:diguanylate cyclase (GGDEF)-like protein
VPIAAVVLIALVLGVLHHLLGALRQSNQRAEELRRLATTDNLTGLANRKRFMAELASEIDAAAAAGGRFYVLLMDLDRFKEINDTLGHHFGDELLRQLGARLIIAAGREVFVARLGGDEFGMLCHAELRHGAEALATRLIALMRAPVPVDELVMEIGASVGIAAFPADGRDAAELLRCADIAMYRAKEGHHGVRWYAPEHDISSLHRVNLCTDLRRGIEAGELVVEYQPKVDPADLCVHGAEALVRWQHPTFGLLGPAGFIPAVEQTDLIGAVARQVLELAIAECALWRRYGYELTVAVNLSARNLIDRALPDHIEELLRRHGIPAHRVVLELTESMLMIESKPMLETIARLDAVGLSLSVDDFGTGYSSLATLRRLPIDELKIDRAFVTEMESDDTNLIIVRSTVNLGHELGLSVTAEGVEDEPTLERLGALGADLVQGFHVARPMAGEAFLEWLIAGMEEAAA